MRPKYIILHHTAGPMNQTFEAINAYHKQRFNFKSTLGFYVGYQYLITSDGAVHQARKDTEEGAHTIGYNQNSIGISVTGWFDDGHDGLPNEKQQETLARLLVEKLEQWNLKFEDIKFHREFAAKSCPGLHITKEWVNQLIKNYQMPEIDKEIKKWAEEREQAQGMSTKYDWWKYAYDKNQRENVLLAEIETIKSDCQKQKEQRESEWNVFVANEIKRVSDEVRKENDEQVDILTKDLKDANNKFRELETQYNKVKEDKVEAIGFFEAAKLLFKTLLNAVKRDEIK